MSADTYTECRTCGFVGPLTPGGHCFDVAACTKRRIQRAKERERKSIIQTEYSIVRFIRDWRLPKNDGAYRYLHRLPGKTERYEIVYEKNLATPIPTERAIDLAKVWGGEIVPHRK